MNIRERRLGDLALSNGGFVDGPFGSNLKASEYVEHGVPIIRLQNIRPNEYLSKDIKFVTENKAQSLSRHWYRPGDVVIAKLGAVGTACVIPNHCEPGIIVADVVRFRGDPREISHQYLSQFLNSTEGQRRVLKPSKGTTRLRTNLTDLKSVLIPLPAIEDQIRIAHLLGKVEGLIVQRRKHLRQLDDLLKSVFLEMFGDPISNPKKFPIRRLPEFYINPKEGTKCGPFGSALKKDELVDSGVPVWNMDNIATDGQMVLPFRMWITADKYDDLAAYSVQDGDIIISRAGTVGKMCVARMDGQPAIISTNLIRLRLGEELRPLHFVSLMLYCKRRVGRLKTGSDGAFTHMNTGVLDSLEFPYPPVELQDRFGEIAKNVENIKSRYQQSLVDLKTLYGALSEQAFNGGLDLSRVPFPGFEYEEKAFVTNSLQANAEENLAINLPDTDNQLVALKNSEMRNALIGQWIEAYRGQLGTTPFSAQHFMTAAQARLVELHPDNDFELGADDYEHIKAWVFKAITSGTLAQAFDDIGNRVQLKAVQS